MKITTCFLAIFILASNSYAKSVTVCNAFCLSENNSSGVTQNTFIPVTAISNNINHALTKMKAKCGTDKLAGGLWYIRTNSASELTHIIDLKESTEKINAEFISRICDTIDAI